MPLRPNRAPLPPSPTARITFAGNAFRRLLSAIARSICCNATQASRPCSTCAITAASVVCARAPSTAANAFCFSASTRSVSFNAATVRRCSASSSSGIFPRTHASCCAISHSRRPRVRIGIGGAMYPCSAHPRDPPGPAHASHPAIATVIADTPSARSPAAPSPPPP